MRWLVTGGCGFIGQELVAQLMLRGHDVRVLDLNTRAATGWRRVEGLLGKRLRYGDVCKAAHFEHMLTDDGLPDVVVHMAAQSHVDASLVSPVHTWEANAIGTQVVASRCAVWGVPLLLCSTDEVYGTTPMDTSGQPVAVREDAPLAPSSPYSASKAGAELAVRAMGHSAGLRYAITRGSNAFGPWQLAEKLVPIACSILQAGGAVPLHGGGSQLRQWVHVADFAAALRTAGEALVSGEHDGACWNIAGPEVHSVFQVVQMLAAELGVTLDTCSWASEDRPGQDHRYVVSGEAMAADLGWRATRRFSDSAELQALLQHYDQHAAAPQLAGYVSLERARRSQ
jgi:dTDP-glucose 4,6-dehydratase